MYLAHSKDDDLGVSCQTYSDHIHGVLSEAHKRINYIRGIDNKIFDVVEKVVLLAAEYHDLGKLDDQAQQILSGKEQGRMINHVQAGTTYLLKMYDKEGLIEYLLAAYIVHAHHIGFESRQEVIEVKSGKSFFDLPSFLPKKSFNDYRSVNVFGFDIDIPVKEWVDNNLSVYLDRHNSSVKTQKSLPKVDQKVAKSFLNKYFHMKVLLSILCDSDHSDTCKNYKGLSPESFSDRLSPKERMEKLQSVVASKQKEGLTGQELKRQNVRNRVFNSCSTPQGKESFISLVNGLVGSGKTYGLMHKALSTANEYGLKNIYCVLPYIALIEQSYEEYAKAISLNEKDKKWNINPVHSMADYSSAYARIFAKTFFSPISLTTSVNFFETILANNTGRISNIYRFTNSVICIDEYHAIVEHQEWGLLGDIISQMKDFNCRFILSSGTSPSYWDMSFCSLKEKHIEYAICDELYEEMLEIEKGRMKNKILFSKQYLYSDLVMAASMKSGSLFMIFNTKKRAARFFKILQGKDSRPCFLRTSALTVGDREKQMIQVKEKLNNNEDVILIGTQGSDIGLDLSFDHAFKELSDFNSIGQTKGRVNRGCEKEGCSITVFELSDYPHGDEERVYNNIGNEHKINVLKNNKIYHDFCPSNCTDVVQSEIDSSDPKKISKAMMAKKRYLNLDFRWFEDNYSIISSAAVRVLVDKDIYARLKNEESVPFNEIQRKSVQMYLSEKLIKLLDKSLVKVKLYDDDELYCWLGEYDPDNYGLMYAIDPGYPYPINDIII
jgi:CRISPR-associated endonuclease/helicase Cas3